MAYVRFYLFGVLRMIRNVIEKIAKKLGIIEKTSNDKIVDEIINNTTVKTFSEEEFLAYIGEKDYDKLSNHGWGIQL